MSFERSSGILLHPTSLPGKFGIGDLGSYAYYFVDFLENAKQTLWQILPLGPTSFGDSPYQSFSTFAGNPLLISPELLIKEELLDSSIESKIPFFSEMQIDYGEVILYKNSLFKKAYQTFKKKITSLGGKELSNQFKDFCEKNEFWLEDYSLFVSLKDYFIEKRKSAGETKEWKAFEELTKDTLSENLQKDYYYGAVWSTWPAEIAARKPSAIKSWKTKLSDSIQYYKFLQFYFSRQWLELKKYANDAGISLIGDIPIFVAYDSADVWANPKNFYLDTDGFPTIVAGVPPDYFSATGQLWGNPLYNWAQHEKEGYKWWIARIKNVLHMVDIIRIDHFRGFESYWAVPFGDKDATGGEWKQGPNSALFLAIEKELGELPIIAEDLGIITEEVKQLRDTLGFPGMKVLQFAFDDSENNEYLPHNYDKNAVVYTGTHDNDTTVGWYEKASTAEQDKFRRYMNVDAARPSWDFIRLAMSSTAVFSIFPLQDVLCLNGDFRMNMPSTASGNWQFRFKSDMLTQEHAKELAYLTNLFARKTKNPAKLKGKEKEK